MAERCLICGSFFIFKNGEFICPSCNCTVSEDEYFNDDQDILYRIKELEE